MYLGRQVPKKWNLCFLLEQLLQSDIHKDHTYLLLQLRETLSAGIQDSAYTIKDSTHCVIFGKHRLHNYFIILS